MSLHVFLVTESGAWTLTEHDSIEQFKSQIRELLRRDTLNSDIVTVIRNHHVYTSGECDDKVYLVVSGLIKVLILTPEGRECLVDVYPAGEIFGELSLCGQIMRLETAIAMEDSTVKQISARAFLNMLGEASLLGGLVQYLASRMAEQQQIITNLITANCEQRLAMTLLRLARRLGHKDPQSLRIIHRLSQSELAKMVGTTRTRIGLFLKRFRALGLVDMTREQHLIVRESRICHHLESLALGEDVSAGQQPARASGVRIEFRLAGGSST
jgi:CRP/FNR family transcriptional regulator, cyclic AMP receptor protein